MEPITQDEIRSMESINRGMFVTDVAVSLGAAGTSALLFESKEYVLGGVMGIFSAYTGYLARSHKKRQEKAIDLLKTYQE